MIPSKCAKIASRLSDEDTEAVNAAIDSYSDLVISNDEAAKSAVSDVLAQAEGEKKEYLDLIKEQYPELSAVKEVEKPAKVDVGQVSESGKEGVIKYEIQNKSRVTNIREDSESASGVQTQIDLFAEESRKEKALAFRDKALRKVSQVRIGIFYSGIDTVESVTDAAHILAPLRKYPVEQMTVLVLDKDKKPITVARVSIGTSDAASVYPRDIAGTIHAIDGADSYYLSHNHPSGRAAPSNSDKLITEKITELLDGSGVDYKGHVVIGEAGTYQEVDADTGGTVKPRVRKEKVSVTEGKFTRFISTKKDEITSPSQARSIVGEFILPGTDGNLENGIIWLDNKHSPIAFTSMTQSKMEKLRTGKKGEGASKLFEDMRNSGASVMFILTDRAGGQDAIRNIKKFAKQNDISLLDAFSANNDGSIDSVAESSGLPTIGSDEAFFSRVEKYKTGTPSLTTKEVGIIIDTLQDSVGAKIIVRDTESSLPPEIITQAQKEGAEGEIRAVHWKGDIYIVADQMRDRTDVEASVLHEGQHYAGDNYFGKGKQEAYQALWMKIGGVSGMKKLAKQAGFNMDSYFKTADDLLKRGAQGSRERAVYLVDEFLAHTKQQQAYESFPARIKRIIKEFYGKIRDLLRKSGFVDLPKANDADISYLLKTMNSSVRGKPKGGALNKIPAFMTFHHGSPHRFDKFSMEAIGTGEGAQAYGHGLYFAESKDVAGAYQKNIPHAQMVRDFLDALPEDAEIDEVIELIGDGVFSDNQESVLKALDKDDWLGFDYPSQAISAAYRNLDNYDSSPELKEAVESAGAMYEVEISDEHVNNFLNWDAPLSEQPQFNSLKPVLEDIAGPINEQDLSFDFKEFYNALSEHVGGDKQASEYLNKLGIKGIKYYDAASRAEGEGTRNLVVFDENIIEITAINGESVTKKEADKAISEMRDAAMDGQPMFSRSKKPDDIEQVQEQVSNDLNKGQPIDKVFRKVFQANYPVIGPVDEITKKIYARAVHYLTEAELPQSRDDGVMSWMNGFIETARHGLIDRYGLPNDYIQREFEAEADKRQIELQAMDILKVIENRGVTSVSEAQVLQAVLTGEAIPNDSWSDLSAPIRDAIDQMGKEAMDLGLISAESYEKNKGSYLHRVYRGYESQQTALGKWAAKVSSTKRKQVRGDQLKGRGMNQEVTMSRLLKDSPPDWWGRKIAKGQADKHLINKEFHIFDLEKAIGQGTEDLIEGGKKRKPKIVDRVYWPVDLPIPARLGAYNDKGKWIVRDMRGDKLTLWRDFSKKERVNMGEILDSRYTIAKTFMLMAHDLSTGRFLKDIAGNENWATHTEPLHWENPKGSLSTYANAEWIKVPSTNVSGTKVKKWGAVAGMYLRAEIWRDLNELDKMQTPSFWQTILTQWKLNKTARNPVVHMNNVMSNMIFMDMADIRWRDLKRGLQAYIEKNEHYKDAMTHGAFGASYIEHEIRRDILDPILQDLMKQDKALRTGPIENWMNAREWTAKMSVLGKIADVASKKALDIDRKMVDIYQLEDEVFRMATYMHRLERGDNKHDAAKIARDQFLNYDIRAPWVNAARRSFLPFISYTYRAVPVIAKSISERPWKIAKYATLAYAMNALAYAITGDDEDEERRSMHERTQGKTWLGTPRMIRMPFSDENDNPVFLDIRRWIPAGDVFDMNQNQMPIPAWLQFGGPLMLAGEFALNKQAFTGKEIVNNKTDTAGDKASKYAGWAWRSWMPAHPLIPGSWYFNKISTAATGGRDVLGRDYDLPMAALSSLGVKLAPQDIKLGFQYKARAFNSVKKELQWQARQLQQDKHRGLIDADEYEKQMQRIQKKVETLQKNAAEVFGKQ